MPLQYGDIEVTPEYETIRDILFLDRPVITLVCGKAGSGKTTLIKYLQKSLDDQMNVVVVAPTGVAALNAGGVTIHSFFRFPPHLLQPQDIHKVRGGRIYRLVDLLIIDEVSMVRADILDNIDRFLRINRNRPTDPFGGVQILLVGDLYQLPPIAKDRVEIAYLKRRYGDHMMFWSSLTVQTYGMTVVELSHIFRQTDPEFTALLNRVRVAEDLPNTLREMNALGAPSTEKPSPLITLTATNQVAENINHSHLQALPGKLLCAKARIEGDFRLDVSHLPSPENLYLKQGAQVMFTRNGEGGLWVNGTLGRVLDVRESKPHPEVIVEILSSLTTPHQHNTQVSVIPVKWEIFKYRVDEKTDKIVPEVIGSYQQYPLMLAWAVTIHKSQGKTLERVCVNLGNGAFASGQVYTALSRCRSIQDLTFETPINPSDIICDPHVGRFFADLQEDSISYEQVVIQRYGTPSRVTFSRWDFRQKEREEEEKEEEEGEDWRNRQ